MPCAIPFPTTSGPWVTSHCQTWQGRQRWQRWPHRCLRPIRFPALFNLSLLLLWGPLVSVLVHHEITSWSSEQTHYLGLKSQIVCEDASGASEAAEVEETSIPGGGWRVMDGRGGGDLHPSWCTFHGTAGGGWRVMEVAEAAEVEETSIPGHSDFCRSPQLSIPNSWYTFHGTAGSGWRVAEAVEVAEVTEVLSPPSPPPPLPPPSPSIHHLQFHEMCTNYLNDLGWRSPPPLPPPTHHWHLHKLSPMLSGPDKKCWPLLPPLPMHHQNIQPSSDMFGILCSMLEGYSFMIAIVKPSAALEICWQIIHQPSTVGFGTKHVKFVVEIAFFEDALQTAGHTTKKPDEMQAAMRPPPSPPLALPHSAAGGHPGARGGRKLKGTHTDGTGHNDIIEAWTYAIYCLLRTSYVHAAHTNLET
ncbi:hypothetical protein B0H17DRAFT_1126632 [Mycena rosella]|uniref:Uncharacterized protein n=1 Tax=Mycena rosella TaxID=1033263 RepID=A0AAD7M7Q0_MYCRO|nr:hypothetical protein B0H17DRAFT_1126632 [Mycena rosella]